jgi:hypothetical protein
VTANCLPTLLRISAPMGSRICHAKIFPPVTDLTDLSDRGGGSDLPSALSTPFLDTEPDCYLNSNAPADFFNISVFPARSNGMRTPRRGRPYERNAGAWVFRTNRLLHCCRILLSTGLPMRAISTVT